MTTIKVLVVFLCAAIGTACGYAIMRRYRRDKCYFDCLVKMIDELKHNITFRKDKLADILGRLSPDSALLKKNVEEYICYVGSKAEKPALSRGFLSENTYAQVVELFSTLGASDENTQLNRLNEFSGTFERMRADADAKYNKYGAAAVKLGFLFGLGVGVLTL